MRTSTRRCPKCDYDTTVSDTRFNQLTGMIERDRTCIECRHRFKTVEISKKAYDYLTECKAIVDGIGDLVVRGRDIEKYNKML